MLLTDTKFAFCRLKLQCHSYGIKLGILREGHNILNEIHCYSMVRKAVQSSVIASVSFFNQPWKWVMWRDILSLGQPPLLPGRGRLQWSVQHHLRGRPEDGNPPQQRLRTIRGGRKTGKFITKFLSLRGAQYCLLLYSDVMPISMDVFFYTVKSA